jgi:hypothetical protein
MPDADILRILSGYINERDNAKKSSPFYEAGSENSLRTIARFSNMINGYAAQLAAELPLMNLAELEAMSELINSRLNYVRTIASRNI